MNHDPNVFQVDPRIALRSTALLLRDEFDGVFSLETIERYLHETFASLEERATINRFLPILAERRARERLDALASWRAVSRSPAVLFVSAVDGGRSRMAQALLHRRAGEGVLAWASVGAAAGDSVLAVQALDEVGVLLSDSRLLRYDDDLVRLADVVVTLGGEACPLEDGHRYEDWTHGSRVDRTIDEARRSRDLIATRVDRLAAELGLAHVA